MASTGRQPDYESLVPKSFGDWNIVPSIRLVTPADSDALENQIYSQMVGRGYVDHEGHVIMLLVAYGPRQSDRLQLHRPEICYVAEGFRVSSSSPARVHIGQGGKELDVRKIVAQRENRIERITYWMRVGNDIVSTLLDRQWVKLRYGLDGLIPDGVLVRVSTVNLDAATADSVQAKFLSDLITSISDRDLRFFLGEKGSSVGEHPVSWIKSDI